MRMLVLGAGLQGSACAYDLLRHPDVELVTLADHHGGRLPPFVQKSKRLKVLKLDVTNAAALKRALKGQNAVLCALPYYFNAIVAKAAVAAGVHHSDLGGNTEIVRQQLKLEAAAKKKRVSVVPDCGLAPGMVNILAAEGIRRVGAASADSVQIYVGGLPQKPEPPLNYQIVYSLEGALDYYTTPSWVLRDSQPAQVDALSELEPIDFPKPLGQLEAFHTGGGISTMPWAWAGKIRRMEYKTLRYPGHVAIMKAIRELGLLDTKPIKVKGESIVPRAAFIAAVSPKLTRPEGRDLVALRVVVTGTNGKRAAWELLDYYDEATGISAMMRTTGYSLSITGLMQVDGRISQHGVHTPDVAVPFGAYVNELAHRGVRIQEV